MRSPSPPLLYLKLLKLNPLRCLYVHTCLYLRNLEVKAMLIILSCGLGYWENTKGKQKGREGGVIEAWVISTQRLRVRERGWENYSTLKVIPPVYRPLLQYSLLLQVPGER